MYPELFSFYGFTIYTYGFLVAIGVLVTKKRT